MKITFFLLALLMASGCTTSWVKLDGTAESAEKISEGEKKCQIGEKRHRFNQEKNARKYALFLLKASQDVKEMSEDVFEDKENKMHRDIESCMKNEGLKKAS